MDCTTELTEEGPWYEGAKRKVREETAQGTQRVGDLGVSAT